MKSRPVAYSLGRQIAGMAAGLRMEHRPGLRKATMQGLPRDMKRADAKLRKF